MGAPRRSLPCRELRGRGLRVPYHSAIGRRLERPACTNVTSPPAFVGSGIEWGLSCFASGSVVLACALLGGCTTYYQVTDPGTGKTYFTTKLGQKQSGAVTLVDAKTGAKVTLQTSEVSQISKERFKEAMAE